MQRERKDYDPVLHESYRALVVKQPYASGLVEPYRTDGEHVYAMKSIEVRSLRTAYRGDVLICSSAKPEVEGLTSGATMGIVELYDVKPLEEFTPEDWEETGIPEEERGRYKGFGWMMRDPRRVVEIPTKGQLGLFTIVFDKGDIVEYPRKLIIDERSWKLIKRQMK